MLAALALAATTRPAGAHAVVVGSDPPGACPTPPCAAGPPLATPPTEVAVRFSEPVRPFAGGLRVVGPAGRRAERGPVEATGTGLRVPVDAAEEGTYAVTWRVIAGDTHPARGGFTFSVGHAGGLAGGDESASLGGVAPLGLAPQAGGRWLHFLGLALAGGVPAFAVLVLRPLRVAAGDRVGGEREAPAGPADPGAAGRLWRLVHLGVLLLVLAEALALCGQTASLGASEVFDPEAVGGALDSPFGRAAALRLGAAVFLWVLAGAAQAGREAGGRDRPPGAGPPWSGPAVWAGLAVSGLLALFDGAAAHATTVRPPALGLLANGLHLAAMCAWVGGLLGLAAVWRLPELSGHRRAVVDRFGRVAGGALVLLATTGTALALLLGVRPATVTGSPYGVTLAAKLAAALLALLPAAVAVRLARRRPRPWWLLEAGGLLVVLALAALLVSLPPP